MADEGGGREGDWECSSCSNRNYAFRSFCNRCKQPRLLVDFKTPHDSKWLPRIGDWICTGCTNNNYASREKCKKCGQPKELAAMPAVTIHGASVPSHLNYFARVQGDTHIYGSLPDDPYGLQQTSTLHLAGNNISGFPFATQTNQLPPVPNGNGWRTGDWICTCGFHNYSSRVQCKKCNAPTLIGTPSPLVSTSALGTKRMASEEMHNLDKKRLNAGQACGIQQSYEGYGGSQFDYIYRSAGVAPSFQANLQMLSAPGPPLILGKGAKQWRDGDWMCSNCNNHNYASRDQCNRCKSERESSAQPVSVS